MRRRFPSDRFLPQKEQTGSKSEPDQARFTNTTPGSDMRQTLAKSQMGRLAMHELVSRIEVYDQGTLSADEAPRRRNWTLAAIGRDHPNERPTERSVDRSSNIDGVNVVPRDFQRS